jgi:hypothetical protein
MPLFRDQRTLRNGTDRRALPTDRGHPGGAASSSLLVEVAGVEPASSKLLAGLLRAQPVEDLGWSQITGVR